MNLKITRYMSNTVIRESDIRKIVISNESLLRIVRIAIQRLKEKENISVNFDEPCEHYITAKVFDPIS